MKLVPLLFLISLLTISCAEKKSHLVAPHECITVVEDIPLTQDGKNVQKNYHPKLAIHCTRYTK